MFCSKCGANLEEGAKFCPSCGRRLGPFPQRRRLPMLLGRLRRANHRSSQASWPFVIIAVAAVAVIARCHFCGNPTFWEVIPRRRQAPNGMGNSVTNIAVGEGQAVSAGGMDYFFDGNGLECAKANDPGSVKQICSISSDGTSVGMLNYADSYLFYVQEKTVATTSRA